MDLFCTGYRTVSALGTIQTKVVFLLMESLEFTTVLTRVVLCVSMSERRSREVYVVPLLFSPCGAGSCGTGAICDGLGTIRGCGAHILCKALSSDGTNAPNGCERASVGAAAGSFEILISVSFVTSGSDIQVACVSVSSDGTDTVSCGVPGAGTSGSDDKVVSVNVTVAVGDPGARGPGGVEGTGPVGVKGATGSGCCVRVTTTLERPSCTFTDSRPFTNCST